MKKKTQINSGLVLASLGIIIVSVGIMLVNIMFENANSSEEVQYMRYMTFFLDGGTILVVFSTFILCYGLIYAVKYLDEKKERDKKALGIVLVSIIQLFVGAIFLFSSTGYNPYLYGTSPRIGDFLVAFGVFMIGFTLILVSVIFVIGSRWFEFEPSLKKKIREIQNRA